MRLAIAIPTYNEAKNIPSLLPSIKKEVEKIPGLICTAAIIDDNSPDGTGKIAEDLRKKLDSSTFKIKVFHRKEKNGLGKAYAFAFQKLSKQKFDYVLQMDADFSHNPQYIKDFVAKATESNADLIVGSRYVRGGATPDWSFDRKLLSYGGNLYNRLFLGSKITDWTGGFNMYSTELLKRIDLDGLESGGYTFQVEMKSIARRLSKRIYQIPIIFKDRTHGTSKIPGNTAIQTILMVPQLRFKNLPGKTEQRRPFPKWLTLLSPLVVYLLLAAVYFGTRNPSLFGTALFNPSPDTQIMVWSLNWWPFAIHHHMDPFISHYIWSPKGFNLTWATSLPTLALLLAPFTWIFGAIATFNLIAMSACAVSALVCFWLVYYLTKRWFPSVLAGYIFGFSSYQLGQMVSHTNLYVTFLIPLIPLLFALRYNRRIGRKTFIALAAIAGAMQFGISNEVYASFMVFATLALVVFYLFIREARPELKRTAIEFYGSLLLMLVILSPFLFFIARGASEVPKTINDPKIFSSDVLNYIVPTPLTWLGSRQTLSLASRFTGNFSEEGAYIGIPLAIAVIAFVVRYWKKAYVKALAVTLAIIGLCSFGPRLQIGGHLFHHAFLPWEIATRVPLIKSALPTRFTLFTSLLVAIIIAFWLSQKTTPKRQALRYVIVLLGIITLLPHVSQYLWRKQYLPQVFQPAVAARYIPHNANVVVLPYGLKGDGMYYQFASHMEFKQAGGYIGFTPNSFQKDPAVQFFFDNITDSNSAYDVAVFCRTHNVRQIIYTPGTSQDMLDTLSDLGWPQQQVGESHIVTVPQGILNGTTQVHSKNPAAYKH